jgi:dihydrofolate synthase/folylpolyglutamate synthase
MGPDDGGGSAHGNTTRAGRRVSTREYSRGRHDSRGFRIISHAIRDGIEDASWPGRFEIVPGNPPVVVDGAHNVAAARALDGSLRERFPGARRIYVVGIAADKDVEGILDALIERGAADRSSQPILIATRADHPRALDPEAIASLAWRAGATTLTAPTVRGALNRARAMARDHDVMVAAGSLYVVAEAREALGLAAASDREPFDPWAGR